MPRSGLTPNPLWRAAVMNHLAGHPDRPLKARALARELRVPDRDYTTFRALVRQLLEEGAIVLGAGRTLRLPEQTGQVVGVFRANRRGFGFLERPASPALYVDERRTGGALDGDTVAARLIRRRGSAPEAEVVRIVRRAPLRWFGILERCGRGGLVRPSGRIPLPPVHIPDAQAAGARFGDVVLVEPDADTLEAGRVVGSISENLGSPEDGRTWARAVIRRASIPDTFPQDVRQAATQAADRFDPAEARDREDLRSLTTVTIDPPDARDFDDAISIEHRPGNLVRLGVHIADVAHFVPAGGPVDLEARRRGTSVYFPGLVVPMLPEALSNGVCSLLPQALRFTQSVFLTYDEGGKLVERAFARSVIRSTARLTYPQVAAALEQGDVTGIEPQVMDLLRAADRLARRIQRRRVRAGMISLAVPEVEIRLDARGEVIEARARDTSFAHTLIEMFMVEANEAVSSALARAGIPHLRRVHPPPDPASAEWLGQLTPILGHAPPAALSHDTIQRLLHEVRGTAAETAVHYVLLRALAQASYSPQEIGHFALASRDYCHFTSPIRRYPDLTVHRLLPGLQGRPGDWPLDRAAPPEVDLVELGQAASALERRAQAAEREADARLLLLWMRPRIGERFEATITGVAAFGVFVQVRTNLAEGVIRVLDFGADDWRYERSSASYLGLRTGRVVHLGQTLTVRLVAVDDLRQELTFVPEGGFIGATGRGRGVRARGRKSARRG